MSAHVKMITAFIISALLILPCYGDETTEKIDSWIFRDLSEIKYFDTIRVILDLDQKHKKISGLSFDKLIDFLKLKYKNNFAGIPNKKPPKPYYTLTEKERNEYGSIWVSVMTTGDEYPVAYHVELKAGPSGNYKLYEDALLGYCSKSDLEGIIKRAMAKLMEEFAITFLD